jgi:hypothetical protein
MTAYSTAVGPSSETRKRCTFLARLFIASSNSRRRIIGTFQVNRSSTQCSRSLAPTPLFRHPSLRACVSDIRARHFTSARLISHGLCIRCVAVLHPFGSQANAESFETSSLGFAPQPCGWFAFIEDDDAAGSVLLDLSYPWTSLNKPNGFGKEKFCRWRPLALTFQGPSDYLSFEPHLKPMSDSSGVKTFQPSPPKNS